MIRPRTLFGKLILVFLTFGAALTIALLVVMKVSHERYHAEADQTINSDLARRLAAANFLISGSAVTGPELHRSLARLQEANPDADFYLVDDTGRLVAGSSAAADWRATRVRLEPITAFLAGRHLPIFGDDPRHPEERVVFSAAPIAIAECPARYLYVVLRRGEHDAGTARLREYYEVGESAGFVLLVAVLAVVLSLLVVRNLTHRLSVLDKAMHHFQSTDGQGIVPPPVRADPDGDEIDRLTHMCFQLSNQVRSQMATLQTNDDIRRELLANVSHDLRTPITTIQTYLETLSSGDSSLVGADHDEYIDICLRQTRRLAKLVEQLLEVAKLDARQVVPHMEVFPMAELLHDVAQKFALAAKTRGLTLRVEATDTNVRVSADIALIERVLDNLIDNALRFSPAEAQVVLRQSIHNGTVRVAVRDEGRGLTTEEQERIFDRFYRARVSRDDQRGHAGLGLAIVRGILQLHGSSIQVESMLHAGSTFWFDLPNSEITGTAVMPGMTSRP